MKHNYCIFSAQYAPHVGGVERYTWYLAKKLVEHGNKVTVVSLNTAEAVDYENQEGITVYRLPAHNYLGGRYPVGKKNHRYRELMHRVFEESYDLMIIQARFYLHSLEGAKLAKNYQIPCITIEHGTSHLSVNHKVIDWAGQCYEHMLTFFLKKYCKNYYGVSKACCEWSSHFHIVSQGAVYNAVDVEEIQRLQRAEGQDYRKKYGISSDTTVIAFTGRLIPEKGILQLTEAVFELAKTRKVCLLAAGDGALYPLLQKEECAQLHFLGQLDFSEIVQVLTAADIFCLPSDSEGFPTSVLEAAACKCFVITTFRGGAKELLLDESYGMILKDNTTKCLVDALESAIEKENDRILAEEKTFDRLVSQFTWESTAGKIEEIARQLNGEQG